MPTAQPVHNPSDAGYTPAYAAPTSVSISVPNNGSTLIHFKNGATVANASLISPVVLDGQQVPPKVINLPANGEKIVGPIPRAAWNQSDGTVQINFDNITTVTMEVYQVQPL